MYLIGYLNSPRIVRIVSIIVYVDHESTKPLESLSYEYMQRQTAYAIRVAAKMELITFILVVSSLT